MQYIVVYMPVECKLAECGAQVQAVGSSDKSVHQEFMLDKPCLSKGYRPNHLIKVPVIVVALVDH